MAEVPILSCVIANQTTTGRYMFWCDLRLAVSPWARLILFVPPLCFWKMYIPSKKLQKNLAAVLGCTAKG